jgi:pimeloyl-ACP methyl ester carboxylesterase
VSARSLARSLVLLQIYGKTHYHLEGPSYAKELVVFIHGVGDYGYRFECMANAMNAAGYRTLRFDIFGRGFSESPDDCRYDVDMYVGHVQSLLQRLELADMPVTVVGHSMGGLVVRSPPSIPLPLPLPLSSVATLTLSRENSTGTDMLTPCLPGEQAMAYCELYPDLVSKIVLLAPAGVMSSSKIPCCFSLTQRFFQLAFCLTPCLECCMFKGKPDDWRPDHLTDGAHLNARGGTMGGDYHPQNAGGHNANADAAWSAAESQVVEKKNVTMMYSFINMPLTRGNGLVRRVGELFQDLRRPCLLLRGSDDPIVTIGDSHLRQYQRAFGNMLDAPPPFPNTGHCFHLEQPQAVHATMLRFMQQGAAAQVSPQGGAGGGPYGSLSSPLMGSE